MDSTAKIPHNLLPNIYQFLILSRHARHLIKLATLVLTCVITVETYYFAIRFDVDVFLQHAELYVICLYACIVAIIYPRMIKALLINLTAFKSLFCICLEETHGYTKEKIVSAATRSKIVFYLQCTSAFLCFSVTNYYWLENKESLLAIVMLHEYVPKDSILARVVYFLIFITIEVTIIPSLASPMYFVYVHFHMEVKLIMLTDYVHKIDIPSQLAELNNTNSADYYYTCVMKNLAKIAKRHLLIKSYNNAAAKQFQLLYMMYICARVLFGLSAICTVVSPSFKLIKSLTIWIGYFVFSCSLTHVSQAFEDASTDLAEAISNLNWYNWNTPCRKSYLILITGCSKGMPVSLFLLFDANYSFYKKVCRFLYSVAGFLYSIRR